MTMTAGSVAIADDGSETKSGMAEAIYDELVDNFETDNGVPLPAAEQGVPIKRGYAVLATRVATGVVAYIKANGEAKIGVGVGALQYTPNPNNPDTPTAGNPITDHYLPIV